MKHLVDALYLLILVFVSPLILIRAFKHGRYLQGLKPKFFGFHIRPANIPKGGSTVWLHAVSVGEVQLLRTVIARLRSVRPDLQIVVSTTTDSGFRLANELFPKDWVTFAPLDLSWAVRNSWKAIQPSLVVLMELEIWPNWLTYAEKQGCPVIVVNGRLSERSFRGYSKLRRWISPVLRSLDWVGAQNEEYAERFRNLGVPPNRVYVTGNIKFDGTEPDRDSPQVIERRDLLGLIRILRLPDVPADAPLAGSKETLVWVAGSTQEPEDSIVLEAFQQLAVTHPELKLILVPRHPERFEQVAKLIVETGMPWARRSECLQDPPRPDWRIFLGDSVGELRWWWGLADVGFVGGSFGDRGGQNMLEPCAYGVATCFGPNTKNFRDIVHILLQGEACEQLTSPDQLGPWVKRMIEDREFRSTMGNHAKLTVAKHRGAMERTWTALERFLPLPVGHTPPEA